MKSKVSIIKCASYDPACVQEAVNKAIDLIGGITAFIKPQSKVLVKPNLLVANTPECGIDTHPTIVQAMIKILKGIGSQIYLGDGPSVWGEAEDVDRVYELSGMRQIAEDEDIELVKFDRQRWYGKFPLTTWINTCDYIVSLPKFKTHDLMVLTGAIKNLYGCVTGVYKTELHKRYFAKEDFAKILVDIWELIRPSLTVIDGITAMEGDGPASAGTLRNLDLIFASSDCVALDSILAQIMGLRPKDILTTQEASLRNLGNADLADIEICGENLKDLSIRPFKLPTTSLSQRLPRPIVNVLKHFLYFYPRIDNNKCTLCQDCVKICPNGAMGLKRNRIVVDYKKCISCFCCSEVCRYAAIKVKKSLLAKCIGM